LPGPAGEHDSAESAGVAESPKLSGREVRSPRDMLLSLAILIVPIALLLLFYKFVLNGDAPVTVDPSPTIQEAQQAGAFPVVVPQGLGGDWHPSSATFSRQASGATLRIGYVDPDKDPIQLVESSVPSATLLPAELTDKAQPVTTFRAANGVWRLYHGRPGEQALIKVDRDRTIIVVGKAGVENLERLASALG
jgi:hypothetical protein